MKKMISLILALVLSVSLCVTAFAAGGFSDVPSTHWAYSDIMACADQGIVTGFTDGSFHPGDNVTTVQFLVMMTRTFHADKLDQVVTPAGQPWYYANLKVAEDAKLTKDVTVDENPMNRHGMAQALFNEIKIADKKSSVTDSMLLDAVNSIKDANTMTALQKTSVGYCYALGILSGMSDGTFSGEASMTRAQACAVIVRMMNLLGGSTPTAPVQPTTPTQPEQPQQPEPPAETETGNPDASSVTVEYALEVIAKIKEEYPTGTPWGPTGTPNNNTYSAGNNSTDVISLYKKFKHTSGVYGASTVTACGGWAAMISDAIFGQSGAPAREVTDPSKVRPGDICISFNSKGQFKHISVATSSARCVNGEWKFDRADGNIDDGYGVGRIEWYTDGGSMWSNANGASRVFTRYAD